MCLVYSICMNKIVIILKNLYVRMKKKSDLFEGLYRRTNEWFFCEQRGDTLVKFLEGEGIHKIAVYGMGDFANRIYDEVQKSSLLEVVFEIDKNKSMYSNTDLYTLEEEFPQNIDAIIITDFNNYEQVEKRLKQKGNYKIFLLDDIIYNKLG